MKKTIVVTLLAALFAISATPTNLFAQSCSRQKCPPLDSKKAHMHRKGGPYCKDCYLCNHPEKDHTDVNTSNIWSFSMGSSDQSTEANTKKTTGTWSKIKATNDQLRRLVAKEKAKQNNSKQDTKNTKKSKK